MGPHLEYSLGPAGETVDVGVVAPDPGGEEQPHHQRDRQGRAHQHPKPLFGHGHGGAAPFAGEAHHGQHIHAYEQQPALGEAGRLRLVVCRSGGGGAGALFTIELVDEHVLGSLVQPHEGQVVEAGAAPGQRAVAAHPGEHRQGGLVRPGAAVQLHVLPFAAGVVQAVGVDEHVLDGQGRAVAVLIATGGPHHAGKAVQAVRLDADGLGEAGVVLVHVGHGHAVAVVAVFIHRQQADSGVGQPHVPSPALGQVAVQLGKTAVDQQVFPLVGQRRACGKHQKQRQYGAQQLFHEWIAPWI